jgi:hypothetical protein
MSTSRDINHPLWKHRQVKTKQTLDDNRGSKPVKTIWIKAISFEGHCRMQVLRVQRLHCRPSHQNGNCCQPLLKQVISIGVCTLFRYSKWTPLPDRSGHFPGETELINDSTVQEQALLPYCFCQWYENKVVRIGCNPECPSIKNVLCRTATAGAATQTPVQLKPS